MEADIQAKTIFEVHSNHDFIRNTHHGHLLVSDARPSYGPDIWASGSTSINDEDATPAPEEAPLPEFLRVTTDHEPRSSSLGFMFGSDKNVCDILVATSKDNGVSKRHFALQIELPSGEGTLIFKSHSRHGTRASSTNWNRKLIKTQRAISQDDRELSIEIGNIRIRIEFPDHSQHHIQWQQHWSAYCDRYALQAPVLNSLRLGTVSTVTRIPWQERYHIGPQLGKGGFGTVYRVTHHATGAYYAAKQYHKPNQLNYRREIDLPVLTSLSHESIVKFYEICEAPPALIMELVDGINLRDAHEEFAVAGSELREVMRLLADALHYLHDKHITHRDLKPDNIMVSARHPIRVKLIDFGLATSREEPMETFNIGTPGYWAPELESKSYTNKVDIWSLGVIAFELAFGLPRYRQEGWYQRLIKSVSRQHVHTVEECKVREFITSLLRINPDQRPTAQRCKNSPFALALDLDIKRNTHTCLLDNTTRQCTSLVSTPVPQPHTRSSSSSGETTVANTEFRGSGTERPPSRTGASGQYPRPWDTEATADHSDTFASESGGGAISPT
ncbi:kinase-like domain-containing protein [Xylaria sp. FL1777]|nr:kinase-like domain-containing protein [Xylaria sp. FL1777]